MKNMEGHVSLNSEYIPKHLGVMNSLLNLRLHVSRIFHYLSDVPYFGLLEDLGNAKCACCPLSFRSNTSGHMFIVHIS